MNSTNDFTLMQNIGMIYLLVIVLYILVVYMALQDYKRTRSGLELIIFILTMAFPFIGAFVYLYFKFFMNRDTKENIRKAFSTKNSNLTDYYSPPDPKHINTHLIKDHQAKKLHRKVHHSGPIQRY